MVTASGNSNNPTNPTYPTNPTTINSGELTDKNPQFYSTYRTVYKIRYHVKIASKSDYTVVVFKLHAIFLFKKYRQGQRSGARVFAQLLASG